MPVTIRHEITDTNRNLDDGKVDRPRRQLEALIGWLWEYPKTQHVAEDLTHRLALDGHVDRLRRAITRQAPLDTIKDLDRTLFDAILAQRQIIGNTFSDHVRALLGGYVPHVASELVGRFVSGFKQSPPTSNCVSKMPCGAPDQG